MKKISLYVRASQDKYEAEVSLWLEYYFKYLKPDVRLFPNCKLAEIVSTDDYGMWEDKHKWSLWMNSSLDIIGCKPFFLDNLRYYEPLFAIEVDGVCHDFERQRVKDNLKDEILKEAGLPIARIKSKEDLFEVLSDIVLVYGCGIYGYPYRKLFEDIINEGGFLLKSGYPGFSGEWFVNYFMNHLFVILRAKHKYEDEVKIKVINERTFFPSFRTDQQV